MQPPSPEAEGRDATSSSVYSVLLHHNGLSPAGSTTAVSVDAPSQKEVALRAHLCLRHQHVCLVLTYNPCKQPHTPAASTPATKKLAASFKVTSPKKRASKLGRSAVGSRSFSTKHKSSSSSFRKGNTKTAAAAATPTPPSTPVDPHRHPKQYYVVALKGVSPLAAQRPLSAELRAHLRLNMLDGEAVTYSSHSTPRATGVNFGGSASTTATATLMSNFYFPPSRGPPVAPQRTRLSNASGGFSVTAVPAYGQYLSAEEPYQVHTRSPQLLHSRSGLGSGQHSFSLGDGDFPRVPDSHSLSKQQSKAHTPLLTPQRELLAVGRQASTLEKNTPLEDRATPPTLPSPTVKSDTIHDYAELLLVAFFGVVTSAGVPNMSFSTDARGEVMVEKKAKKMTSRPWHASLFKWFVSPKPSDAQAQRSVSVLSTISGVVSSVSGSPHVSPSQPNTPAARPAKSTKQGKLSSSTSTTTTLHKKISSPVSAAAAHADPRKVLELPFAFNQHETFHLRFLCEEDLHGFLSRYIQLQTRAKEAADKAKNARPSSPLWHPRVRRPTVGANRFGEEDEEDGDNDEGGVNRDVEQEELEDVDSASTATYTDYPRNADALDGGVDASLSADLSNPHLSADPLTRKAADPNMTAVTPPPAFFRSRGWEDYLRHTLDPRFSVRFAAFPLYLWHSFLPLSKLVLYSCIRGFLIVERVPPETSHSDEDSSASYGANLSDPEKAVEMGKQRLNALVNRLLTPIRTAQSPTASSSSQQANRDGVVEVVSVLPVPFGDDKMDDEAESYGSSGDTSWDAVKLVLPSTDEATKERNDDHFTTVKDVFLCLSESHLLFMNSFGHLRFHCSLDEIALITYSADTAAFPTYPFFRFRLKSSDYFGAPTFVLTFTLLPEVPHDIRAASLARVQAAHQSQQSPPQQQQQGSRVRTLSVASSSSSSSSTTTTASTGPVRASNASVDVLEEAEKERLLRRHEMFLHVFAAVCPRPLEFRTFAEVFAGEMGRSTRIRFSQLTTAPKRKVSGSPMDRVGLTRTRERGTSWMGQNFNANPILCVKVEADDVELYDAEISGQGKTKKCSAASTSTPSPATSTRERDASVRQRSNKSKSPEVRSKATARAMTPRWGCDDRGIVLQDAGRDMDFSFEVATRTMPLLATKEQVHAGYGSAVPSAQQSFHSANAAGEVNSKVEDSNGGEEFFVPMVPKKKQSVILHRSALEDM
ncbi:hypothetical protein ABB37_09119 [Leptomonas pyrrhocoris]|uniref:Uncharacterized protein n=1 Tax=Leptomonas pyrrhocoris TaxID=157538 RepID=A0A0M9FR83_LEPPY|nr:hypothetical protein ABB37_09119 [Leptomonas pyrrhocoris]XP_015652860.1 hypothetical protein ABB37_09119 [Leptomonas pyrrhocoris]KPA74420.1 hypothetical protein ABB37_09119 [Leptomonas pyrrhocoris]KPA74421.1 hypothetical protein ABB37_09119 [Leptomonas pyrrhocoris]|eukprot:XP_015652859.1 hypothetical protein ABB37_09119 [Leptomonas pyrrhocoris]